MRRIIHTIVFAGIATVVFIGATRAEEKTTTLPEIAIGGGKSPTRPQHCGGLETGSSQSYKCLNDTLRHQVESVNPRANIPPLDARSTDIKIGVVNMPAVKQQYGQNFGISVIPYRPPLPVYGAPLGRR